MHSDAQFADEFNNWLANEVISESQKTGTLPIDSEVGRTTQGVENVCVCYATNDVNPIQLLTLLVPRILTPSLLPLFLFFLLHLLFVPTLDQRYAQRGSYSAP